MSQPLLLLSLLRLPLLLLLTQVLRTALPRAAIAADSTNQETCLFEDYTYTPQILTPTESNHRYVMRHFTNAGMGHLMSTTNIALKYALHNNLTYVHNFENYKFAHLDCPFFDADAILRFKRGEVVRSTVERLVQDQQLHTTHWPTKDNPVSKFQNEENAYVFSQYIKQHGRDQPHQFFSIPQGGVSGIGLYADQDSDYRFTGAYWRYQYERELNALTQNNGKHAPPDESDQYNAQRPCPHVQYAQPGAPTRTAPHLDPQFIHIGVHVRRGDTLRVTYKLQQLSFQEQYFAGVINTIIRYLADNGAFQLAEAEQHVRIHVFSQPDKEGRYVNTAGEPADFGDMLDTCKQCIVYHLKNDTLVSFDWLVKMDFIIPTAPSLYSHFAAMLSRNIKISARSKHTGPQSYVGVPGVLQADDVHRNNLGHIDADAFADLWARYEPYRQCRARGGTLPHPPLRKSLSPYRKGYMDLGKTRWTHSAAQTKQRAAEAAKRRTKKDARQRSSKTEL